LALKDSEERPRGQITIREAGSSGSDAPGTIFLYQSLENEAAMPFKQLFNTTHHTLHSIHKIKVVEITSLQITIPLSSRLDTI
jgi:hypothetical protein